MNTASGYRLHPEMVWVNENHGQVRLIPAGRLESVWLSGAKAILWRAVWLGYDLESWNGLLAEEDETLNEVLSAWEAAGWVTRISG